MLNGEYVPVPGLNATLLALQAAAEEFIFPPLPALPGAGLRALLGADGTRT